MEHLNEFQKEFMEALAAIQEQSVQLALSRNDNQPFENKYYDITAETIVRVMELLDGYGTRNRRKLNITCKESGESLKDHPSIELHDAVCDYLKGAN